MRMLNGSYALTFNQRHGFSGHLFDRRYGATFIQTDEQLWSTARYVAFNPVEAGLCADPADWIYGSIPATLGLCAPREFLDSEALLTLVGLGGPQGFAELLYQHAPVEHLVAV
jgi:hypothetical protein